MRIGYLCRGSLTSEQQAAYDRCADVFATEVHVDDVIAGRTDLATYDALWWHRDTALDDAAWLSEAADTIADAVQGGTGLFLSLHALEAVEILGIDETAPDATGNDGVADARGLLQKRIYDDHPLFAEFDDRRVHTRGPGVTAPYARYEGVLPDRGDVLACAIRGEDDVYKQKTVIGWDWGDGAVIGAGADIVFHESTDEECTRARERFVESALTTLATQPRTIADRPSTGEELTDLRVRAPDDPNRPQYHITPPANWLNDPNGLFEWNGRYHVFYQYNPAGPFHDTIHWGHAVSDDLVHWEDVDVALAPDPDGPDRYGCWSGCTVVHNGKPTFVYTGWDGTYQLPCLAHAVDPDDPDLREWEKESTNPVIEELPVEIDVISSGDEGGDFRDHCVWREGDDWYQLIGSGVTDVGGTALLYRSPDLRDWTYLGPILTGAWEGAGPVWECPELLDLGETSLLHVSNYSDVLYFLGEFRDRRFTPDERGKLDHGDFYAPQSLEADDGRTLTFGWIQEARPEREQWDAGWSGALSFPRVLSVEDGDLRQRPAEEVSDLREDHEGYTDLTVGDERDLDVRGTALEFDLEIELGDADAFELVVRASPDGEERTPIRYTGDEVIVDRHEASRDPGMTPDEQRLPVDGSGSLSLRVFLDGSVVEIFANARHCLTSRVYPERSDSDGVSVAAEGGETTVERLDVWTVGSAWPSEGESL